MEAANEPSFRGGSRDAASSSYIVAALLGVCSKLNLYT